MLILTLFIAMTLCALLYLDREQRGRQQSMTEQNHQFQQQLSLSSRQGNQPSMQLTEKQYQQNQQRMQVLITLSVQADDDLEVLRVSDSQQGLAIEGYARNLARVQRFVQDLPHSRIVRVASEEDEVAFIVELALVGQSD